MFVIVMFAWYRLELLSYFVLIMIPLYLLRESRINRKICMENSVQRETIIFVTTQIAVYFVYNKFIYHQKWFILFS